MFYEFDQNNSGGKYHSDDKLCHRLIIEADSLEEAEEKAFDMGVYYDGCNDGRDCPCCGDRWYGPQEMDFPYRYSSFGIAEAKEIAKKHNANYEKTTWRFMNKEEPDPEKYDVVFKNPESYLKYLADNYGFGNAVDGRVFYKNGKVFEV